ncbi:MAG: tetratricopeptide repeat protein, partial [Bacteroidota bacterium]
KNEKMIREYVNILAENGAQQNYVQSMLQARITDEKDWATLEKLLYDKVQDNPDRLVYNEMLIWYYLQKKEFYRAFLQARAVDKRKQQGGQRVLSVGTQSLGNEDYKAAIKIFTYLVDNYKENPRVYFAARNGLMTAKEALVKQTYPIDLSAIRSLVQDYKEAIEESGLNNYTAELARNQALLHAFYLNSKDTAIQILEELAKTPQLKQRYVSQAKIDLGDIFLLRGEWWESTLLYSQVEKAERERDLGHEAKLRNAKLSYYRGDFPLAKSHLDVLKLATSRKIANNAMELSLLIQENTGLDTSEVAMQRFAAIDLLVFQQQYPQAMEAYDKMLEDFPDHSLEDEIFWRKAQLYTQLGKPKDAQKELEKIVSTHNEDIFGDDANFTLAKLYEEEFNEPEKAMELYLKQLTDYPDSIYNAEARKRLRRLRGDDPQ